MSSPPETSVATVRYAGFSRRAGAMFIDGMVFLPFLLFRHIPLSFGYCLLAEVIYLVSWPLYSVILHTKYGQTIGKMLMGIKVVQTNLSPIGFRHAFRRESIHFALVFCNLVLFGFFFVHFPNEILKYLTSKETHMIVEQAGFSGRLLLLTSLWSVSEIVTLLFNKRRRALHDFLGGTVVIEPKETENPRYLSYGARASLTFIAYILLVTIVGLSHPEEITTDTTSIEREGAIVQTVRRPFPALEIKSNTGVNMYEIRKDVSLSYKDFSLRQAFSTQYFFYRYDNKGILVEKRPL